MQEISVKTDQCYSVRMIRNCPNSRKSRNPFQLKKATGRMKNVRDQMLANSL